MTGRRKASEPKQTEARGAEPIAPRTYYAHLRPLCRPPQQCGRPPVAYPFSSPSWGMFLPLGPLPPPG